MRTIITLALLATLSSAALANTTYQGGGPLPAGQTFKGTVESVTTGTNGAYSSITVKLEDGSMVEIDNSDSHLDANEHGSTLEKAMDHGNDVTLKMGPQDGDLELVTRHRKEVEPQPAPEPVEPQPIG